MVPLCCIYTARRRRRQYVLIETSTFPLFWVKHESSLTNISKYFHKRNNNKKDYYIELNLFFLCCLACFKFVRNKHAQVFRIGLTLFRQYTCQNICDSFFLNWTYFNIVAFFFVGLFFFFFFFFFVVVYLFSFVCFFSFCLQWTPTVIYLYLVCIINWQPVWLENCWHAVNLDKQTLDTGVLRKKNYSLFLNMNCYYMYLFLLRKQIK